jgi:hypothetical protein
MKMPEKRIRYKYKVTNLNDESYTIKCSKYKLKYYKGTVVYAHKHTHGIMVFKRKCDAENFGSRWNRKIKRVITYGKGTEIDFIKSSDGGFTKRNLDAYYENLKRNRFVREMRPPEGTWCYPKVKVID